MAKNNRNHRSFTDALDDERAPPVHLHEGSIANEIGRLRTRVAELEGPCAHVCDVAKAMGRPLDDGFEDATKAIDWLAARVEVLEALLDERSTSIQKLGDLLRESGATPRFTLPEPSGEGESDGV